jgi:hypothetical protein
MCAPRNVRANQVRKAFDAPTSLLFPKLLTPSCLLPPPLPADTSQEIPGCVQTMAVGNLFF